MNRVETADAQTGAAPAHILTPEAAWSLGLSIIPVGLNKKPLVSTWKPFQTRQATKAQLRELMAMNPAAWATVTGQCSGVIVVDFDGQKGRQTMRALGLEPHVLTGSGGYHVYFAHPGWHVPTLNCKTDIELGKAWPGLDVRGDGGYAVFSGRNETGEYRWLRSPEWCSILDLPIDLRKMIGLVDPALVRKSGHVQPPTKPALPATPRDQRVGATILIDRALQLSRSEGRNNAGFWLAMQLRDNGYSQPEAENSMRDYVSAVPPVNAKGQRETYTISEAQASVREAFRSPAREPWGHKDTPQRSYTAATGPASPTHQRSEESTAEECSEGLDLLAFGFNDHGNSQRLLSVFGSTMRYCHPFKKWLIWDGRRWEVDESERARRLAIQATLEFLRQAIETGNEPARKFATQSLDAKRITNMLAMAQSENFISPAALDTNPDHLNFLNCTVDLRSGTQIPHRPEDYITKLVHHRYEPTAQCPRYLAFLARIMGSHADANEAELDRAQRLVDYLQKAKGYSLTGRTSEKVVFFTHGGGNNGKTTDLNTIREILPEYSVVLQIDTLMTRQESNNTQADLADLRGARFVMTSETEEGQRLAEGKLKRITQGMGKIKAVRKYENPIEFLETHKLWMDCNHKPRITGSDNAIWNRLHLIPYTVTIPADEIDRELSTKLTSEAEGILAWLVEGAKRWYAEGLGRPLEIEAAVQDYRDEMDQVGRFIEECCVVGDSFQCKARALHLAYKKWAEDASEYVITETAFGRRMAEKGLIKQHTKNGSVYEGIGLRS
ncbi:MAG TPA: phage/plasmid primase, P4 family [Bryobacteraceae bacterium]|nr:phage/plasmid primase, P4 family [Bryobacteraceae bacterium]